MYIATVIFVFREVRCMCMYLVHLENIKTVFKVQGRQLCISSQDYEGCCIFDNVNFLFALFCVLKEEVIRT